MVLVDTSVWIDHFRKGNTHLKEILVTGRVACNPFVIGELACGNLNKCKLHNAPKPRRSVETSCLGSG